MKPKSTTKPPKPSTSTGSGGTAKLKTRIVRAELGALRMLKKNARYMAEPEFNRLVENLRRDGVLTSLPLVYRGEVLSGNHRVQAALKAAIVQADVIEIETELSEEQRACWLSHNALTSKTIQTSCANLRPSRLTGLLGGLRGDVQARGGRPSRSAVPIADEQ
jgi:hypothetical protein